MLHKWGSRQLMTDASLSAERAHGCQGKMKEVGISCLDFFFFAWPSISKHTTHSAFSSPRRWVASGVEFCLWGQASLAQKCLGKKENRKY